MTALAATLLLRLIGEVAHIISDKIYELTGEEGYFDTRKSMLQKVELKSKSKANSMDQDGANTKYLTLGKVV